MALKAEIEKLKQQKQNRNNTEVKTHEKTNCTWENFKITQHPKNVEVASGGDKLETVELLSDTTFVIETMKTLATYRK